MFLSNFTKVIVLGSVIPGFPQFLSIPAAVFCLSGVYLMASLSEPNGVLKEVHLVTRFLKKLHTETFFMFIGAYRLYCGWNLGFHPMASFSFPLLCEGGAQG